MKTDGRVCSDGSFCLEVNLGNEDEDILKYGMTMREMISDLEQMLEDDVISNIVRHGIWVNWKNNCEEHVPKYGAGWIGISKEVRDDGGYRDGSV